jgi:hypothetical protein
VALEELMNNRIWISMVAVCIAFSGVTAHAQYGSPEPSGSSQATAGDLEKVAADGKSITVKTADGTEEVFKVTGKTTVDGAKGAALAGKEGTHVVVHYTAVGAEKTAIGVKDAGKGTWEVTEGTVTKVGEGGKDVTVKLKDGTEKTYHVGKDATVDTGHGIVDGSKYTAKAGDKVAVYATVDPTKEVVHLFKKL